MKMSFAWIRNGAAMMSPPNTLGTCTASVTFATAGVIVATPNDVVGTKTPKVMGMAVAVTLSVCTLVAGT